MKIEVWPLSELKISNADLRIIIIDDRNTLGDLEMSNKNTSKCVRQGEAIKNVLSRHDLLLLTI